VWRGLSHAILPVDARDLCLPSLCKLPILCLSSFRRAMPPPDDQRRNTHRMFKKGQGLSVCLSTSVCLLCFVCLLICLCLSVYFCPFDCSVRVSSWCYYYFIGCNVGVGLVMMLVFVLLLILALVLVLLLSCLLVALSCLVIALSCLVIVLPLFSWIRLPTTMHESPCSACLFCFV
jgi:hypothetical protein